uniref:Eukaryotic translation initiation factor 4E family member 1c n=1 Tax=Cyprinus carpio TaxID=7962 RepID=A0A8C2CNS7_CYPCA
TFSSEPRLRGTENEEGRADSPTSAVTSPEQYIKHPLQNRWALWYFKNDKSKSWTENLRLISKFDTVEDFWALYNHIQQPSKIGFGCDYSLFKDGIKPMWEDDRNKLGGRWLMTLNKQQRHNDLDRYWMETVRLLLFFFFFFTQQYKERLSLPSKTLIGYQSHDDTSSKSGSTTKNMYSV